MDGTFDTEVVELTGDLQSQEVILGRKERERQQAHLRYYEGATRSFEGCGCIIPVVVVEHYNTSGVSVAQSTNDLTAYAIHLIATQVRFPHVVLHNITSLSHNPRSCLSLYSPVRKAIKIPEIYMQKIL